MNDHVRVQELICLSLYGECTEEERTLVASHLRACAACAAYAEEAQAGLGVLASGPKAIPLDDSGWAPALDLDNVRRSRPWVPAAAAAAAFVLGVALGAWRPASGPDPEAAPAEVVSPASAFARSSPPAPAQTRGYLALLSDRRAS